MVKVKVPMKTVAVLNSNNVLTGSVQSTDGIEFGDLPVDGSYKYDEASKTFIPVGHGFGKVKTRQPFESDLVLAELIDAVKAANVPLPFIVSEWREWYETEMRRRHEELSNRRR